MAAKTPPSQTRWKAANTVAVNITISKNADPDLYELFAGESGNRGAIARELLREAIAARKEKEASAK